MDFVGLIIGYGFGILGFWMIYRNMTRIQQAEG